MVAGRSVVLLCALLLPARSTAQPAVAPPPPRAPLAFEANRGQTDPRVRFLARGQGYTLFPARDETVFRLFDGAGDRAIRMTLLGAHAPRATDGIDPLPGRSYYFHGTDPSRRTTDVPTYAKVRYSRGWDAFVARLNPSGRAFEFASYLGGEANDHGHALALDTDGNIYVAGHTASSGFPIVQGAQPEKPGPTAAFVSKIGEQTCGTDVTGQVPLFQSAIVPFFPPRNLQLVIVWNSSPSP